MTKKNLKKRGTRAAFLSSLLSLLLCVTMLVGTTVAWFTDSVTSGNNIITAGNLDIGLQYKNELQTDFADMDSTTNIFRTDTLWEPGHVEYAVLKISNLGTLALKYNLAINIASETESISVATNEAFKLSDFLNYAVVDGDISNLTRDAMVTAAGAGTVLNSAYTKSGTMTAGEEDKIVTFVVWMPSSVGNAANYKTGAATPQITLGIALNANQLTSEYDSFDNQYDIGAPWAGGTDDAGLAANTDTEAKTVKIESAEQLASFAASVNKGTSYAGYTVTLENDIDLENLSWTPISATNQGMIFDGKGHTVLNLKANGTSGVGLFGSVVMGEIKNLNIKNATVSGVAYVGAIVGSAYTKVSNCKVDNVTINATGTLDGNIYKDGAKAGGIVGLLREEAGDQILDCSATNVTINGYRDLGGIVGCIYSKNTVTRNTISNVTINQGDYSNYEEGNYTTLGAIYGRMISNGDGNIQENTGDATIRALTIVQAGTTAEETNSNVKNALQAATSGDVISLPTTDDGIKLSNVPSGVTVKGDGTTKIDATGTGSIANVDGAVLEGLVIDCGNNNYHGFFDSKVTLRNCTINGLLFSYGDMIFENCTFNQTTAEYNMWAYSNVTYKNCTFNNSATGKFVNVYTESGDVHYTVNFNGCTFNNTSGTAKKAAVNVKESCGDTKLNYTVNITNCTTTGAFPEASTSGSELIVINSVVQVDDIKAGTTNTVVTYNGAQVYPNP